MISCMNSLLGEQWAGPRGLQCLDLFSRSARIANTFRKHGGRAMSYDIVSSAEQDVLSYTGFIAALDAALLLLSFAKVKFSCFEIC